MFIATLVALDGLPREAVAAAAAALDGEAGAVRDGVACDISCAAPPPSAWSPGAGIDIIVQRAAERRRLLLAADMDSTMITVECIDELADYAGVKAEVAAVTERAMRGELDFAQSLVARVRLLAGLPVAAIDDCLRERVRETGGARELVQRFVAAGGRALLVSGGFTQFAEPVARALGFTDVVANRLVERGGQLTGEVLRPIIDAEAKRRALLELLAAIGAPATASVAIGDGANDIPMLQAAGFGIAFHAKPRVTAAAAAQVRYGDLRVVSYALGLR